MNDSTSMRMQLLQIIAFMGLLTAGTSALADPDDWGHGGIVLPPPIRGPAIVLPPPPPLPRLAPLPPPPGIYRKGRYYGRPPYGYPKGQYKHHHHRH